MLEFLQTILPYENQETQFNLTVEENLKYEIGIFIIKINLINLGHFDALFPFNKRKQFKLYYLDLNSIRSFEISTYLSKIKWINYNVVVVSTTLSSDRVQEIHQIAC